MHLRNFSAAHHILWAALLSCAHLCAQTRHIKDYKPEDILKFRYEIISQNTQPDSISFLITVRDSQNNHVGGLADRKEAWFDISEKANPGKTCKKMEIVEVTEGVTPKEPINFCLVLDYSGSMAGDFEILKRHAQAFMDGLPGNRFTRVNFDDHIVVVPPPHPTFNPPSVLKDRLSDYGGTTALYNGIVEGIKTLENTTGQRVLVVFSDGHENASGISANDVILKAWGANVVVHAIGYALAGHPILVDLCEKTGGKYYPAGDIAGLAAEFGGFENRFSHYYNVKLACRELGLPADLRIQGDTMPRTTIKDAKKNPLLPGNDISFGSLIFKYNSTELIDKQRNAIQKLAPIVAAYLLSDSTHTRKITLRGHTSPEGDSLHNAKLSRARVDFVFKELSKQIERLYRGKPELYDAIFARNRILISFWGEKEVLYSGYKNWENRRVEITAF